MASAEPAPTRPRYYDLATADGVPYWKIALLHLDSVASTVNQTCAYWGNADQCAFCGIGVTLANGRETIARKTRRRWPRSRSRPGTLDGAVDATLTTGTTATPARARSTSAAAARPCTRPPTCRWRCSFEPPRDLDVIDRFHDMGISSVGIHVETFDPRCSARIARAKARPDRGLPRAWERAVAVFGEGQVSTYVPSSASGEDPDLIVEGCRRAIDIGVYPFVVPCAADRGQPDGGPGRPSPEYCETIFTRFVPYLSARGLGAHAVAAGCARCPGVLPDEPAPGRADADGRTHLPLLTTRSPPGRGPPGRGSTLTCRAGTTRAELVTPTSRSGARVFVAEQGLSAAQTA